MLSFGTPGMTNDSTLALVAAVPMGRRAGNRRQRLRRVFEQRVFVGGNGGNADLEQIINRRAQSDDARDVWRAGLEFFRRVLINRFSQSARP